MYPPIEIQEEHWKEAPLGWLVTSRLFLKRYELRCFGKPDPTGTDTIHGKRYTVIADMLNFDADELMEGAETSNVETPREVKEFADKLLEAEDARREVRWAELHAARLLAGVGDFCDE